MRNSGVQTRGDGVWTRGGGVQTHEGHISNDPHFIIDDPSLDFPSSSLLQQTVFTFFLHHLTNHYLIHQFHPLMRG